MNVGDYDDLTKLEWFWSMAAVFGPVFAVAWAVWKGMNDRAKADKIQTQLACENGGDPSKIPKSTVGIDWMPGSFVVAFAAIMSVNVLF